MPPASRGRVLGIDVGGTFADCVVLDDGRVVAQAKAPATPDDPLIGILEAIEGAAAAAGGAAEALLGEAAAVVHGTTVGLNALLERSGATVGLLTTRGHEDALLIGRVHQKVAGLGPDEIIRVAQLSKPEPLVPRWRIHGVVERLDASGAELVRLDEADVRTAAERLGADGCDSIAISFLWSFRDPAHERRAAEIVRQILPQVPVSLGSDVAPVMGEYERTAAAVVNAYLRRIQPGYLDRFAVALRERAFRGELEMMLSSGGTVPARDVTDRPVETLRSGPVGGAVAVARFGRQIGARDLLATDMGGTSFDAGLIVDGRPELADVTVAARLHLAVPSVRIDSIGAGGGSVAWVDDDGRLHVGPRSMGADPGPACYGRGGTEATVTDADLVLGRLGPGAVVGGRIALDRAAAERAVGLVAERLGLDLPTTAAGIVRVADGRMADLLRRVTVERGHDPRSLVVVAYGGAAGLHAGAYGFDVGAERVVVPAAASLYSAVGLALAERQRVYRRSGPFAVPLDAGAVATAFAEMERLATADLLAGAASPGDGPEPAIRREIDFRYRRQTHQVTVRVDAGAISAAGLAGTVERFEHAYEALHGPGTGYRPAGIEATGLRIVATVSRAPDEPPSTDPRARGGAREARPAGRRPVYFDAWNAATPVHDGGSLRPGDCIPGPAVVDWPTTGVVVHPGQQATVDALGHLHLARGDRR